MGRSILHRSVLFTGYIDLANNQSRLVELMIADGMMGATAVKPWLRENTYPLS
uniref:hypothetical protein n=1 Tax=Selenomonas ruminantium TaxID=971 RepID=UPI0015952928|nr:hypothetical protein [Selenomonas ruminantium]